MSNPKHHHYLPIFYLKRWASTDGDIYRFSRPYGDTATAKRVVPKGTAFEKGLYSISDVPLNQAALMERDFMSVIDTKAAVALKLLENNLPNSKWDSELRGAWSRFIWSLPMRTPEAITQIKSMVKNSKSFNFPNLQKVYERHRPASEPPNWEEHIASLGPRELDEISLFCAKNMMIPHGICQTIMNMHWAVLDLEGGEIPLLTSDRPVLMPWALSSHKARVMLPIGPTKMFIATNEKITHQQFRATHKRRLAKQFNKFAVQSAIKFVFGVNDHMLPFVQKHMSTATNPTPLDRLTTLFEQRNGARRAI